MNPTFGVAGTTLLLVTEAAVPGFSWWVLAPTLVIGSVALAAAPIWPYSRGWGWPLAGIFGVAAGTAALFTLAWWFS